MRGLAPGATAAQVGMLEKKAGALPASFKAFLNEDPQLAYVLVREFGDPRSPMSDS